MNTRESAATWPALAEPLSGRTRVAAFLLRVHAPLIAIVAFGLAFSAYYTIQMSDWLVMTDELLYVKLAQSIGQTLSPIPAVHGHYFAAFNQLYPLLTAPVFALLDMPAAFKVVHVLNSAIMASTAIPAYLLAREVVRSRLAAYLVAALTISVPWVVMSTMILTEVAAYPAFVWAIWTMQRAVAAPSTTRDLVAIAGILLAFLARTQFLLLGLVFPVAVLVHELGSALSRRETRRRAALLEGSRRAFHEHRLLALAVGLGTLVALPLALTGSLAKVLGNYETAVHAGSLLPSGILRSAAVHLDFVVVAAGVLPFVLAAAWCLGSLVRPSSNEGHSFAAILVVVVPALTLEVASFDLRFANGGVQDRYLFYIVPLLFVGMAACLLDARKPSYSVVAAGVAFAAVATLAQYAPSGGPYFGSPASAFHTVLDGKSWQLGRLFSVDTLEPRWVIALGSVLLSGGAAGLIRWAPRRAALACTGLALLAFCVVETRYVFGRMLLPAAGRPVSGGSDKGADWIDSAVADDSSVGFLPAPINYSTDGNGRLVFVPGLEAFWWSAEFWNDSVERAYLYQDSTTYTPFAASRLSLDFDTGAVRLSDRVDYLMTAEGEVRFGLAGSVIKQASLGLGNPALNLIKPDAPLHARWATRGIAVDGWTRARRPAMLRVFGSPHEAGLHRLQVTVASTTDVLHRRGYEIVGPGRTLAPGSLAPAASRRVSFTVCVPSGGFSQSVIRIHGATRLPNRPAVGLRVVRIQDSGSLRPCKR